MKTPPTFVHIKQLPFMQRLADRARTGYVYYLCGTCRADRFSVLHQKFNRLYDLSLGKDQRYRQRRSGCSVYDLLAYQSRADADAPVFWVLVRTEGVHSIAADLSEAWQDFRTQRLVAFERFELIRHTRKDMSSPSWSWRFVKLVYTGWREQIISYIRSRSDRRLQSLLEDIFTAPKFAPIRDQLFQLQTLLHAEYKRSRLQTESPPKTPRLGYTRRVKDQTRLLR